MLFHTKTKIKKPSDTKRVPTTREQLLSDNNVLFSIFSNFQELYHIGLKTIWKRTFWKCFTVLCYNNLAEKKKQWISFSLCVSNVRKLRLLSHIKSRKKFALEPITFLLTELVDNIDMFTEEGFFCKKNTEHNFKRFIHNLQFSGKKT